MEVLMMSGAYAGEIRDIKPIYARQMLADGRAVDPNEPIRSVKVLVPPAAAKKAAAKRAGN